MQATLIKWAENQNQTVSKESPWVAQYRAKADAFFRKTGLPHQKMESWKYIHLRSIFEKEYCFASDGHEDGVSFFKKVDQTQQRLVFVNGIYREDLSLFRDEKKVRIEALNALSCETLQKKMLQNLENERNPIAFLNSSRFKEAYVIQIKEESQLSEPLHVYYLTSSGAVASLVKTCFVFNEHSNAQIVTHFVGDENQDNFINEFCEVYIEKNASVDWINIQKLHSGNQLFSTFRAYLQKGSSLHRLSFSSQGDIIRNDELVRMLGQESNCILKGLAFLRNASQVFDEVAVHHHVGHCHSEQTYKNILADSSKAEFNSLAYVYRDAQKTDSIQLNKNLLLSDDAKAYSRPKLMIYADDVSANHGSASGQLDKKELFYLLSRGLSRELARYVLTLGFAEDILEDIKMSSLRKELEVFVKSELEEMSR